MIDELRAAHGDDYLTLCSKQDLNKLKQMYKDHHNAIIRMVRLVYIEIPSNYDI
jgi:hypothetical protein